MISVYSWENDKDYSHSNNGDMTLFPSKAEIHAELNGEWTATLEHPIDEDGRWKYLVEGNVVDLPSFVDIGDHSDTPQQFRIKNVERADSGITCEMEPIFFDSADDCWLEDVRPTECNGYTALSTMLAPAGGKYTAQSDITTKSTAYYQFKNFLEALNGDDDNSFINRWGGEILYNNYQVIVNERVGKDNDVQLLYGKNTKKDGLTEEIETRDIVTRIYPKGFNGVTMTDNRSVDSPLINSYPIIHTATISFSDVKMIDDATDDDLEDDSITVCETQSQLDKALKAKCQAEFDAGLDKPTVTIEADMILLQNADGYEEFKNLESVNLGDTVHCRHSKLGIVTDSRVIELTYDSIHKRVEKVVLGDFSYNYLKSVSSAVSRLTSKVDDAINDDGTLIASKVKGFLDGAKASLKAQYNEATKTDVMAILFENLDKTSSMYGAMALGTQGLMISRTRNDEDTEWVWTTALTSSGLVADIIIAGLISDKLGNNSWNLETGEMNVTKGTFSGRLEAAGGTFAGSILQSTKNSWGVERLAIANAVVAGDVVDDDNNWSGATGHLDLCAQYGNGTFDVCLKAFKNNVRLQAPEGKIAVEDPLQLLSVDWISEATNFLTMGDDYTVMGHAQSSKRFKDISDDINGSDLDEWYKIQPVWAKYKEGYLKNTDGHYGKLLPMFIAEDVAEHFPEAAVHGKGGTIDDWNHRIMIPAMFQMIKTQKVTIDDLTARLEALEKRLSDGNYNLS